MKNEPLLLVFVNTRKRSIKKKETKMKTISCCFIKSTPSQKIYLEKRIEKSKSLNLLATYNSVMKAISDVSIFNVDVIFVCIDATKSINWEIFNNISKTTQVIIIAAKPEFAVLAFEFGATDYLLHPVDDKRFEQAIEKVKKNRKLLKEATLDNSLIVKSNLKQVKLYINEIQWVEALGDYIKIVTKRKSFIVLSTLKGFYTKLPKNRFLRIHKSYIANLEMIDFYNHKQIEIDGHQLPLSKAKNVELDQILQVI